MSIIIESIGPVNITIIIIKSMDAIKNINNEIFSVSEIQHDYPRAFGIYASWVGRSTKISPSPFSFETMAEKDIFQYV